MMNRNDFSGMVITPTDRKCYGKSVKHEHGAVVNSVNLLKGDMSTTIMKYPVDGEKPSIILDLGPASPGGYPIFRVRSKIGTPVLRVAYSDWYDYIVEEGHAENGDFIRGCCKYLGVELPVLPGNPNRFEQYTINRTGLFAYPLIQGQQRWVLLTLETPGTEVELECFYIHYTSDMSPYAGHFKCSDDDLNLLWYASTYTVQIASFDNSQSWEVVEDMLALRALTKGNEAGVYKHGFDWTDYTFEFRGQIARNPHCASGIGWFVRAQDLDNGMVFRLDVDGTLHRFVRRNGVNKEMNPCVKIDLAVVDNTWYTIKTEMVGGTYRIYIDGTLVDTLVHDAYTKGSVGFCQTTEKWAFAQNTKVTAGDKLLFADQFDHGLDEWEFTRSLSFVADGAKRDRLPWSGDLDWAGRNAYYAFQNYHYMPNTLRMFARHQTPEGYIWGTCYPENTDRMEKNEFGYYESDIFSAWFVPTLADYLLFTDDKETATELYQVMADSLDYLWCYVEDDGLFYQRYATSKGLWDHVLNDIGKFSYNNLIVQDAFAEGAFVAEKLGKTQDAQEFQRRAEIVKQGIMEQLWNDEHGYFKKGVGIEGVCGMANSLALAISFLDKEKAARAITATDNAFEAQIQMGKIVSLFIRGCYNYSDEALAISSLRQPKGSTSGGDSTFSPNWIEGIKDWRGSYTTTECMMYSPEPMKGGGGAWGDRSHPDTAMAHILTGYILGVQPTDVGYKTFVMKPHLSGLEYAKGIVPTPHGDIEAEWSVENGQLSVKLLAPDGTTPEVIIGKANEGKVTVEINGVVTSPVKSDDRFGYFTAK